MNFQKFQHNAWNKLFTESIYDVFDSKSFTLKGVTVTFKPENPSAFLKVPVSSSGSNLETLKVNIDISYEGSGTTLVKDLITLPVYSSEGLMIRGTKWCLINTAHPASGWYIRSTKRGPFLTLNRDALALLSFGFSNNNLVVNIHCDQDAGKSIPLFTFLKAVSCDPSIQIEDLAEMLSDCPTIINTLYAMKGHKNYTEPTTAEAADRVLHALANATPVYKWNDPITELKRRLENNLIHVGDERIPRFKHFTSFMRAMSEGVTLAESVTTKYGIIAKGEALTEENVTKLDSDENIKAILVNKGDYSYTLQKYEIQKGITLEEICCALRIFDQYLAGIGRADDPDEQFNKVIHSIKDEYEEYITYALVSYCKVLEKYITNCPTSDVVEYINQQSFADVAIPESYAISKISKEACYQQLDDTNSLAAFEQEYKITTTAKQVSASARDIHSLQYGRICPYTTPESKQVGLNLSLSLLSSVDKYGFIATPTLEFKEGKLATEPVYLSAIDEMNLVIAPATADLETMWKEHSDDISFMVPNCRVNGNIKSAFLSSITHKEVSNIQTIGPLIATVPSANRNAGKRLIMSAAAQRQALPTWRRERPYVTTGIEAMSDIGIVTASAIIADHLMSVGVDAILDGSEKLYYSNARQLGNKLEVTFTFQYKDSNYIVTRILNACVGTIKGALKYSRVALAEHSDSLGRYYVGNEVVIYNNDVDISPSTFNKSEIDYNHFKYSSDNMVKHGVALGNNVKVMFKSLEGYTYEDSIIVSESFLARQGLTIVKTSTLKFELDKKRQRVENNVNQLGHLTQLDAQGYPIPGVYIQTGQAVLAVANISEDGKVKYTTERLAVGQSGFVISHYKSEDANKIIISIALGEILPVALGDKLEGLHGNKGVVGRILKESEMPFTEDGEVPDMILNSLGILARLNLGQIIEFTLGSIAEKTGEIQILEPFDNVSVEAIADLAKQHGLVEKDVYDGRTGLKFDRKGIIGNMYMLRLEHTNTSKFNATSNCASNINHRTMQPMKGPGGGQRMSELCTWCLTSYDATEALNTLFTAQSDSVETKNELDVAIQHRRSTDIPYNNNNIDLLQAYFYMLGSNIAIDSDNTRFELLTQKFIDAIAPKKCRIENLYDGVATPKQILHDPVIFGDAEYAARDRKTFVQLPFGCELIMPVYLHCNSVLNLISYATVDSKGITKSINRLSTDALKAILAGEKCILRWDKRDTDQAISEAILKEYSVLLPATYEIPVLGTKDKLNNYKDPDIQDYERTGIRAIVSMFRRFDVLASICQTCSGKTFSKITDSEFKNLENIILFAQNYNLKDFIVHSMIIPPAGFRQISEKSEKMSNPIDAKLNDIVSAIKMRNPHMSADHQAYQETRIYNVLNDATFLKDVKNPCIREQMASHKSKISIMRDTLLAKRMSYTGRSVITIAPDLEFGYCGIPISMLSTIFEEHIAAEYADTHQQHLLHIVGVLIQRPNKPFYKRAVKYIANNNINGFRVLCTGQQAVAIAELLAIIETTYNNAHPHDKRVISNVQQLFDACYEELFDILKELLETHPALLNREPSLHKFSIQGFKGIPIDSYAIQLHPLNCHGFNADYDGDQMAVIMPMHEKGIKDVRAKMMSEDNMIDPKDGKGIVVLNQDMILGLYYATIHRNNRLEYEKEDIAAIYNLPTFSGFEEPRGKSFGVAKKVAEDICAGLLDIHDTILCTYEDRVYVAEAGRILLNAILPGGIGFTTEHFSSPDFVYSNLCHLKVEFVLTKKTIKKVEAMLIAHFDKSFLKADSTGDTLGAAYNRLMSLGFKMSDLSGITISIHDFANLPIKKMISSAITDTKKSTHDMDEWFNMGFCTEEEHSKRNIRSWTSSTKDLKEMIKEEFTKGSTFDRNSNIFMIIDSGARGDIYQLLEMSGVIGIVTNSAGASLETPIDASYMDGLAPAHFFLNAFTARRQTAAAQLTTADSGELTRKCIYLNDHIRIRDDDTRCDGESIWIDLDYDIEFSAEAKQLFKEKKDLLKTAEIVLDNIERIPSTAFEGHELYVFSDAALRTGYSNFCINIIELLQSRIYSEEFAAMLCKYKQNFFFITDGENYWRIDVTFKLSDKSKSMLMFRVLDTAALADCEETAGYEDMLASRGADVAGHMPETIGDDVVIGEDIIDAINFAFITKVPIYSIIGCKSTKGICRCCFGVKYDSRRFPNFGEHVGYQAVQAIGNPITQIILDSHKSEYTGEKSAKDKLEDILDKSYLARRASEEVVASLPFAVEDDMTVNISKVENSYLVELQGENIKQTIPVARLENIFVVPGQHVTKGMAITTVDSSVYEYWLYYASKVRVQFDVWNTLCGCFDSEDILARNFEVFTRSLTEFGVAQSTNLEESIVKGGVYTTAQLDSLGIEYTPAFQCTDSAIARAGKVVANVAYQYLADHLCDAIVRGVSNYESSNVGNLLLGTVKGTQFPVTTNSVIKANFATPAMASSLEKAIYADEIFVQSAEPEVVDTPEIDAITKQLFDYMEQETTDAPISVEQEIIDVSINDTHYFTEE